MNSLYEQSVLSSVALIDCAEISPAQPVQTDTHTRAGPAWIRQVIYENKIN